jgi:hypothetical protein
VANDENLKKDESTQFRAGEEQAKIISKRRGSGEKMQTNKERTKRKLKIEAQRKHRENTILNPRGTQEKMC